MRLITHDPKQDKLHIHHTDPYRAGFAAFEQCVRYWAPELMFSPPHQEEMVNKIVKAALDTFV